jgi:xanthine dehydrogenase accessory factor
VFVHALLPPPRIVLIGATHIAQVLAELVRLTGFQALVVDPRTAFAAEQRFPGVQLITEWPQDALPVLKLDPYTAVAALAHVGHIDDEALKLACVSECFYVGALGSRKNHAKRTERLAAAGLTADQIARIASPIGLDLGASTPPEIALAIMAEILRHLRGAKGKGAA